MTGAIPIKTEDLKPGVDGKELQALRKKAGVPEIDPDAPSSTYATKMTSCLEKRLDKVSDLKDGFGKIKKPSDLQARLLCKNVLYQSQGNHAALNPG